MAAFIWLLGPLVAPADAAFGLNKLFLDSKTGSENYVFTAANTVYAQGSVDAADSKNPNRSYQFVFSDPSGLVKATSACTPNGSVSATVWGNYTLQPNDPVSTSADWRVVLKQYTDRGCATVDKTSSALAFDVAKATAYSTSAQTAQQSVFRPGATAYLHVAGLKGGQSDWSTTWLLPSGGTACANTGGGDRADADSAGVLPSGTGAFLQYAPGTSGAAWNLQANYDGACPAFAAQNEGAWSVTLRKDATHFMTAAAFSVDATSPTSSSTSPSLSKSNGITVSYTASDASGSGLASVDLYAKGPGESTYAKVATDTQPSASGSFSYSAGQGDGGYSFYTVATDKAGNVEAPPSAADSTTTADTAVPTSSATAPASTAFPTFQVSYSASDSGAGLEAVDLYVKRPDDSTYTKVATDSAPAASGSFDYTPDAGGGDYSFYTRATDKAGNVEPAPSTPDATTSFLLSNDKTPPTSQASLPTLSSGQVSVSYTAADDDAGVVAVDLYVQRPGDAVYSRVATDTSRAASGSFTYTADGGDGTYSFYTRATDAADNVEAAPSVADASISVDVSAPRSQASSAQYSTASGFTVSYEASDAGDSGLATVELWAKGPAADAPYTKVGTDSNPGAAGSFNFSAEAGEGTYSFYTIAKDRAGNVEAQPDAADASTIFDAKPPSTSASSGAYSNTTAFTVTYTAGDGDDSSGVASVDLYVKRPGDGAYTKVASDPAAGTTGGFNYIADAGPGDYSFYTIGRDKAGNAESTPSRSDSTTNYNPIAGKGDIVDEAHYTFTGATSVAFDWRGPQTDIRYGPTADYGTTATAHEPDPKPFSSAGPFQEVELTGLQPGTTYHYSIGGGVDHTFSTPPTGDFRFDVEAGVGSTRDYPNVGPTQSQIAGDNPNFVLVPGDLSYATPFGQPSVDRHFNDVMAWSSNAAYMPVWGNHEYEDPTSDDLRNYKGRFALPHPQTSPSAPAGGCCGEDWSWFDAGGVRFIAYPEAYSTKTWTDWQAKADPIFADAQSDPSIHFIVTFGHRPAYSTGFHPGDVALQSIVNSFGDKYSKYQLNLNGHSHNYERFEPIHGVTHITTGGGGAALETPWSSTDSRTAFRTFHLEHLRVDVSSTGMRVDAICGPPTTQDDLACVQGSVIDSYTIGTNPPPPPTPPVTLYVDRGNTNCSDGGTGTATQPFCSIKPAASRVVAGQTVLVGSGTYNEQVVVSSSGTQSAPINFAAAPGADVKLTGGTDGFYISGQNNITVQGFKISGTTQDGIVVKNAANVTLRGNDVSFAGQPVSGKIAKGMRVENVVDSTVANNSVHHNTDYGVYLIGSSRNQVVGNRLFSNARVYDRAASGIRLYGSTNNTVTSNVSHDNEDSGLEFFGGASENLVTANVAYGNGDHGIDDNASTGQRVIGNSVYKNFTSGMNFEAGSTNALIANNISVENGLDSTRTKGNIRVDGTSTSGTTMDYDLVHLSKSGTMFQWGSTFYSSLSALKTATGQEQHGVQANPLWKAPSDGDLHLTAGSPAIDSANSGVSGQPDADADGNPRVDDPDVTNSGAGPRAIDDRGAFEYEPEEPPDAPPNASFTVNPSGGLAPLRVTADASASTDTDSTGIESYTFDFGDGSTVVGPQARAMASHTYRDPGIYTIKVTVTDTAGYSSSSTTQVAVGDNPPKAALGVTPTSGTAPLKVAADASASTDDDGTPIATYKFDFGDGSAVVGPQDGATADHTYTEPGTYTVKVTVTDTAGNSANATVQATVSAPPDAPPAAKLVVSPSSGDAPLDVSANASQSTDTDHTPIATYKFDFGDGSAVVGPQDGATADHTYTEPGTYTVKVTVTDTAGNASTATKEVAVTPGDAPPTASLTVTPAAGVAPLKVAADASASTDNDATPVESYEFDFGDGSAAVGPQAEATTDHTYVAAGTYIVKVTARDTAGNASSATTQVTVSAAPDAPPSASLTLSPGSGTAPLQVSANASGSTDDDSTPIATYKFDFGDGSAPVGPQAGATANHTYTVAGTYTVKVTVTDTADNASTATTQIRISPPDLPPSAAVTVTPSTGLAPLVVTADASASTDADDTPIASYKFDFGDGTTAVGPQSSPIATHSYLLPGTYTLKVTVTDTVGKSSTATTVVTAAGNLVKNSGSETDLTGWNTSGGATGNTLTRVQGGHSGGWSVRADNTAATASTCMLNDSPNAISKSASGTYTGILWVRADTAGTTFTLRFREYDGGTLLVGTSTTVIKLTTAWQQVTVKHTTVTPGTSTIDLNAYASSVPPGACFYADDAAVYLG